MSSNINHQTTPWIALIGNPNSGKTALFNLLTGMSQKVSNYPGVTVEKKLGQGKFNDGSAYNLLDLPGTYSLTPESFDERIITEQVIQWIHGNNPPAAIISVVDASNLSQQSLSHNSAVRFRNSGCSRAKYDGFGKAKWAYHFPFRFAKPVRCSRSCSNVSIRKMGHQRIMRCT